MNKSSREKEAVLSVFAELVRPLMRVAFEYGISASEIAGVVRRTYIQSLEARLSDQKRDRKSTRLNSSHLVISYAVFCLKKKMRTDLHRASAGSGESWSWQQ